MLNLKFEILAEAHRLGFLLAGMTVPDIPSSYPTFEKWLEAGHHGQMAYLETERARLRRSDPHLILPEVKSILALGFAYNAPVEGIDKVDNENTGKVAAYAAGEDYHLTIPPLLEQLALFAQKRLGQPVIWKGYTDTSPILEREVAVRAGLGWIGKNSCLISPQYGSYFLLAEILWDIPLAPDTAIRHDFCGSCTRCIDACPTECILPNRTLDATRCISYLTIENKVEIAPDLRPYQGDWIFGCDVCQQVCPWNIRFASARPEIALPRSPETQPADLIGELSITPQSFNRKFRRSPILRARRRGYLRNICVALGNRANPAVVPALSAVLREEPEIMVRAHAAWALGRIGGEEAKGALFAAGLAEKELQVIAEIKSALQNA